MIDWTEKVRVGTTDLFLPRIGLGTASLGNFLEAMTDLQFRTWAGRLITTVAGYYILYGSWLLLARGNAFAF